jgi:hypothetical protein
MPVLSWLTRLGDFLNNWAAFGSSEISPKMVTFGFLVGEANFLHSYLNKQFQK